MRGLWFSLILLAALSLAGCATSRSEKPLLTATASARIASRCDVLRSEFHPGGRSLPYATFILKPGQSSAPDGPSPTLRCLDAGLAAYRHRCISFREDPPPTD